MFICKYCGKEVGNKGCLVIHEKYYCKCNPNKETFPNYGRHKIDHSKLSHPAWNKGLTKDIDDRLKISGETLKNRYKNNELTPSFLGKHHSEETKKILSEKRKQYLSEHKDEHVWKRNSKFHSVPCQKLKDNLNDLGIKFVEEYTPFDDHNFSIDIAFPEIKLGIEVNGNQHYDRHGNLTQYYQNRHNIFEERGWKLLEVHYSKCYTVEIKRFEDIYKLN